MSNISLDLIDDAVEIGDKMSSAIEDYAFSRSGQLATLGENAGILKYRIYEEYTHTTTAYSPTTIKSFARTFLPLSEQTVEVVKNTPKGVKITQNKVKMCKEMMHNAFVAHTGVNLCDVFGVESVLTKGGSMVRGNPIGDIVDAYFIGLYHFEQLKKGK